MKKAISILWIILLSLLIVGCTVADKVPEDDNDEQNQTELLNDGELAVNFEFLDYQGNTVTLEDLKGDKVYLKFVASWCSICNRGMPELDALFASEKDYVAYTVVTPNANGEKSIEDFKAWFPVNEYPNIVILFDVNAKFSRKLGALSVPTSVYIGSDGVLIKSKAGHAPNEEVEAFIKTFQ